MVLDAQGERLWVQSDFQPMMTAARPRRPSENADGAAYADAVSEYAAPEWDELSAPTSDHG
ncbi:hypothetical protein [Streptomyces sp. NPDC093149]|uniref:hypothetical protein n=1 Tax=Streptomyces sp. NPDC093149 TaxID=3366031 RepID=UPI00381CD331